MKPNRLPRREGVGQTTFSPQLLTAKSPRRIFGQNGGNSVEVSKLFFEVGMSKFYASVARESADDASGHAADEMRGRFENKAEQRG